MQALQFIYLLHCTFISDWVCPLWTGFESHVIFGEIVTENWCYVLCIFTSPCVENISPRKTQLNLTKRNSVASQWRCECPIIQVFLGSCEKKRLHIYSSLLTRNKLSQECMLLFYEINRIYETLKCVDISQQRPYCLALTLVRCIVRALAVIYYWYAT